MMNRNGYGEYIIDDDVCNVSLRYADYESRDYHISGSYSKVDDEFIEFGVCIYDEQWNPHDITRVINNDDERKLKELYLINNID